MLRRPTPPTWIAPLTACSVLFAGSAAAAPLWTAPVQGPSADRAQDPSEAQRRATLLRDLLDRMELGLQAEVIEVGRPLVAAGGPLAADGQAVATVARALFASGAEEQALELLDAARVDDATRPLVDLERARIAIERDQLDEARGLLQAERGAAAPVRHPDQPDAWLLLARVYARSGRLDLSAQLARRFLELSPLHPEAASAWHLLSRDAVRRRDGDGAASCLERADFLRTWHDVMRARRLQIRLDPAAPLPRLGLALGWMQVERWTTAEALLAELVAARPDYCRAYLHLGEARRMSGDAAGALAAYQAGTDCDPTDLRCWMNGGSMLLEFGRLEESRASLERVVTAEAAADPLYLGAHLLFARVELALGREAEATEAYARYRELGGDQPLEAPATPDED